MPGRAAKGPQDGTDLIEQGIARYAEGNLVAALTLWREAAARMPSDVRARAYVAWAEWRNDAVAREFADADSETTAEREARPERLAAEPRRTADEEPTRVRARAAAAAFPEELSAVEDEPTRVRESPADLTLSDEDEVDSLDLPAGGDGVTIEFRARPSPAAASRTIEEPAVAPPMVELVADPEELPPPPAKVVEIEAEPETPAVEADLAPLEKALARSDRVTAWVEAERLMERGADLAALPGAEALVMRVYRERLGSQARVLTVVRRPAELDPRAAFLVSLADGSLSIEDLLDVCAMPRLLAMRLLVRLLDEEVLYAVERTPT